MARLIATYTLTTNQTAAQRKIRRGGIQGGYFVQYNGPSVKGYL